MSEDHLGEFSAMFVTKSFVHEKILNDDAKKNQSIDIIDNVVTQVNIPTNT